MLIYVVYDAWLNNYYYYLVIGSKSVKIPTLSYNNFLGVWCLIKKNNYHMFFMNCYTKVTSVGL